MGYSVFLAQLHGGPFDGHHAELWAHPPKIVVARDRRSPTRIAIGDFDFNPPPWPADCGVEVYTLDAVNEQIVDYVHAGFLTAVSQHHEEATA